ncbi:switch-associated protein 70-like [Gadus chalcogrammus]|uniref:switch-associated protein 70-like n=1 Tax=Gadus chalcogrammus TaxID=1042646 RepID=UPI0024C4D3C1|nr:switch-associated protein 70-like [Gadus chalcogrammus]
MWKSDELLKPIWHAFSALDVDKSGKVSKSQLKVLSYNLCTVMNIPHDPVSLEEHFKDDDRGPVSNQGYMPYLKRFILEKARDNFDMQEFNKMCWTLSYKKNMNSRSLLISNEDAFKVWCIFNFLCEDAYPLVILSEEIEYLLRKLLEAMGSSWNQDRFAEYKLQLSLQRNNGGLSAWELINLVGMAHFSKGMNRQTVSMGITQVYQELILDVLKQGYVMKKGHKMKIWSERWFILRSNTLSYYLSEDLVDKRGDVVLDQNSSVESLPDREGKKCLFVVRCADRIFELCATDKKRKQEWIQALQTCLQQVRLGLLSPHREARLRRQELRQKHTVGEEELTERMRQLQATNENKQIELEVMRKKLEEAAALAAMEEERRKQTQTDLQDRYMLDMAREKMEREQMEQQVAQKTSELDQYLQRVGELEDMYKRLQDALDQQRTAKEEEEAMRRRQARLLAEEAGKRVELEQLHLQQQRAMCQVQAEKQELVEERQAQERALQAATLQLQTLEEERQGALEQYQEVTKKLTLAANKTKKWKTRVAEHEGLVRLIQPGHKGPQIMTNWGPASFTDAELELRKKSWQEKKNQGVH